jgi:hypothetical protein
VGRHLAADLVAEPGMRQVSSPTELHQCNLQLIESVGEGCPNIWDHVRLDTEDIPLSLVHRSLLDRTLVHR